MSLLTQAQLLALFDNNGQIKTGDQILAMLLSDKYALFDFLNDNKVEDIIANINQSLKSIQAYEVIQTLSDGVNSSLNALLEDSDYIDNNIAGTTVIDLANDQIGYESVMSDKYNNLVEIQEKLNKIFELQYA